MQCTSEVVKSNLHLSLSFTFSSISILHPYTIIEDRIATSACLLFHYLKSLLKFHLYVSISPLKEIFLSLFFPPLTIRHHRTVERPTLHLDNDKFVKSKDRGDRNVSIPCCKFSRKVRRIFVYLIIAILRGCCRYRFPDTSMRRNRSVESEINSRFASLRTRVAAALCQQTRRGVPVGPTFYLPWRRRYYAIDGGPVSWREPHRFDRRPASRVFPCLFTPPV